MADYFDFSGTVADFGFKTRKDGSRIPGVHKVELHGTGPDAGRKIYPSVFATEKDKDGNELGPNPAVPILQAAYNDGTTVVTVHGYESPNPNGKNPYRTITEARVGERDPGATQAASGSSGGGGGKGGGGFPEERVDARWAIGLIERRLKVDEPVPAWIVGRAVKLVALARETEKEIKKLDAQTPGWEADEAWGSGTSEMQREAEAAIAAQDAQAGAQ